MHKAFEKVILIGYGKIAGQALSYTADRRKDYGYQIEFVEHEVNPFPVTEKICRENDIPFARIEDKKELAAFFQSISERTLIVSVSNNFLFPGSLVAKENITIINFHNALLPGYPGRNAPSWVIFMGEKESGVTWHYVTAGVDEGNIIIQKKCAVTADMKAYELAGTLMELAYEAFTECFDAVIQNKADARAQETGKDRRMYRSYEIPGDGFFDPTQDAADIYRLLRSTDYGKNDIFPPVQTVLEGKKAEVLRYRKISADRVPEDVMQAIAKQAAENNRADCKENRAYTYLADTTESGFLYFPLDNGNILRIKCRLITP